MLNSVPLDLAPLKQVMRKYMNFSEESRLEVTQPEVVSFVMQKSEQLAGSIRCSAGLRPEVFGDAHFCPGHQFTDLYNMAAAFKQLKSQWRNDDGIMWKISIYVHEYGLTVVLWGFHLAWGWKAPTHGEQSAASLDTLHPSLACSHGQTKRGRTKKKTSLSLTFTNHVFSVYQSIPFQRYQHLDHHCEGRKEHRPAWAPHGSCCHVALRRSVFVAGNLGKARDAELFRCWASESMQCLFMFRK